MKVSTVTLNLFRRIEIWEGGTIESNNNDITTGLFINTSMAAFIAVLLEQVIHEGTHALVALFSGAHIEWFNLFAVSSTGEVSSAQRLMISGSAALVNIFCGLIVIYFLKSVIRQPLPRMRLLLAYFAAVSLLAGFGYLFFDPIIFRPVSSSAGITGDWATIIAFFGGGWLIRLAVFVPGAAGLFFTFIWLGRSVMHFNTLGSARSDRIRSGFVLLILPYVVFCSLFTLLALWHPLGIAGLFIALHKNWLGYFGFPVAYFFIVTWPDITPAVQNPVSIPQRVSVPLILIFIVAILTAIVLVLPGVSGA
jgi:hypothetical protein